ncbi:ribonuclease domain-containing protein [Aeromicrobium sp. CF3.5]|uniref:ribonuclease domain-containing protein n=1 Tax=Aeromicrobium sp. CF3.5 TaxID=3373078 RepID=UPI003EE4D32A
MRRLGIVVLIVGLALTWFLVVDTSSDLDQGDPVAVTSAEQSLPAEARETIELIAAGGPYPYDRDGAVFENREGLLPDEDRGYWREYTVPTPGSDDRGARRVVTGEGGELYYTDDHYASFLLVRDGSGGDSS